MCGWGQGTLESADGLISCWRILRFFIMSVTLLNAPRPLKAKTAPEYNATTRNTSLQCSPVHLVSVTTQSLSLLTFPSEGFFFVYMCSAADFTWAWKCQFFEQGLLTKTAASQPMMMIIDSPPIASISQQACAVMVSGLLLTIQINFLSADGDSLGLPPDLGTFASPSINLYLSNKPFYCCAQRSRRL